MKTTIVITLFFSLLCSSLTFAQYGNGYGNGYGNNGYGNNGYNSGRMRTIGQQDMSQQQSSKPKEVSAEENAAKIMENLTPALKLDGLQAVAIQNVLAESLNTQGILMKNEELSQEAKIEEYKSLSENTNKMINAYLSPEQQEKYKAYLEDTRNPKKSKKKNKKEK